MSDDECEFGISIDSSELYDILWKKGIHFTRKAITIDIENVKLTKDNRLWVVVKVKKRIGW